ncbi:hypothetical protein HG536_0B00300 [Torulaspora globosa]|uniref:Protein PBN1 n=1 Tax=Torulaspora globosa TaxID=48254 RepID=A0A7G3ZCD3_9SACH|nr:uncharacterized protein HG536_0B00300 [Torulaspora globosa]QLL31169.1 hypothetical protein HG536_0B00300 [Torulaspora globosa]
MGVKSRFTVVFQEAEDVGERLEISDDELTVKGGPDVVVQQRWIIDSAEQGIEGLRRVTWSNGAVERSSLSRVISAALSPGFNVYSTEASFLSQSLETPFYRSYHSTIPKVREYVPVELGKILSQLDAEKCDIDIRLMGNRTEIAQWCLLRDNENITFRKEADIDACEAGLFYLDTRDSIDVNLSGLRCKWGPDGVMNKCQKTTLFYKTAHISPTTLERPTIELETPVGLHPKILIDLSSTPKSQKCEYFLHLKLPTDLFVDRFQSSPLFLYGAQDLELPEYKLRGETWGSESLFELDAERLNEITLHSRYVEPMAGNQSKTVRFTPLLFRACDSDEKILMENPFYSRGLGYESFFTPNTIFEAFPSSVLEVTIPRPDTVHYETTKLVTLTCLLVSLVYILLKIAMKPRSGRYTAK